MNEEREPETTLESDVKGCILLYPVQNALLNPLRSNSDQSQNPLCNINAFSVREVMRIKDMITQHEFS